MKTTPRGIVRPITLVAALVLVAAGCGGHYDDGGPSSGGGGHSPTAAPSTPPTTATSSGGTYWLTLYWSFARHVRGQADLVGYDLSTAPGGGSGACAQSGVDTVVVYDASGAPLSSGLNCVYEGVQGVSFDGFAPGTYDLTVTGYRNGVALYETPISVNVTTSGGDAWEVSVPGIPDDLDVYSTFLNANGVEVWPTCADAYAGTGVETLSYTLVDRAGTTIDAAAVDCSDPAGVSYRVANGDGLDRDNYAIRMQGLDHQGVVVFDSTPPGCADQEFDHLGSDTSDAHGWLVGLYLLPETVCQP